MTAYQAICKIEHAASELGIHNTPEATIAAASSFTGKLYDALNEEWLAGIITHEMYAEIAVSLLEAYAADRVRQKVMETIRRLA